MVLYESFLLFSKLANREEISTIVSHISKLANTYHGLVLNTQDLGLRINKPRVGVFWYGRYYYVAFAANPKIVPNLHKLYNSNSNILRHTTMRMLYRTNLMTIPYSHHYEDL
uniref:Ribosomal protein S6, putative n=1 Tax=Theileria annulata TaxID=5874 RepID=A0A3B0NGT8_THEAN